MKHFKTLLIGMLFTFFSVNTFAQDIELLVPHTFLQDTLGADIGFKIYVVNNTSVPQDIFLVRTLNNLPHPEWTSALCFGELCFASFLDSVATDSLLNPPVEPGDTLDSSIHVFPLTNHGTANVQVQVGTFSDPATRYTFDFTAESIVTSVEDDNETVNDYSLEQNYPNPFNPSTKISYKVKEGGEVLLKVYNILGSEVATLVNEYQTSGNYQVGFNSGELSSGVYLYKISVNEFTQTRKMILEK